MGKLSAVAYIVLLGTGSDVHESKCIRLFPIFKIPIKEIIHVVAQVNKKTILVCIDYDNAMT